MITIEAKLEIKEKEELDDLTRRFQSCKRFAFKRITNNDPIIEHRKEFENWLQELFDLNLRYVRDAILEANKIIESCKELKTDPKKVIFGSKKLFKKLQRKHLSPEQREKIKKDYKESRQNSLYSRGDKSRKGNSNTQIQGNKLRINVGNRKWIYANIQTSHKKWKQVLTSTCYSVRILRRKNQYYAQFTTEEHLQEPIYTLKSGAIGIDLNASPSNIAYTELDKNGNYLNSDTIPTPKLYDSRRNKRENLIWEYAHELSNLAVKKQKGIVLEDLKFRNMPNRVLSNFCFRRLIKAIAICCVRKGVEVKLVHAVYTSIIGCVKYAPLYNLSRHESAAIVIGRRGLGFVEKLPKAYENLNIEKKARKKRKSFTSKVEITDVPQQKKEVSTFDKFKRIYDVCKITVLPEHFTKPKTKLIGKPNWSRLKKFLLMKEDSNVSSKLVPFPVCGT